MNRALASSWRLRAMTGLAAAALATAGIAVAAAPAQAAPNVVAGSGGSVLGVEYEHGGFGGATLIFLSPKTGCTGPTNDVDDLLDSMPSGWDNLISSYRTFGSPICFANHFENSFEGGAQTGFTGTNSFIGDTMNDRTSSIEWS